MKELEYPFDNEYILKKKKSLKKALLEENKIFLEKNIAILGGSTTNDIKLMLELFLLNQGIKPNFYESEYNMYFEDAFFPNPMLAEFKPDVIYIHTTNRNIKQYPQIQNSPSEVEELLDLEYSRFEGIWKSLKEKYNPVIIQNNFEMPPYRLLGNKDAVDYRGKVNFINRLNSKFYEFAQENENFYINDINYLSASYGLEKWQDEFYWNMYKYALAVPAIPSLSFSISNIIKAIYGKNKKSLVLDLDNTLWGGIIGDDGQENIKIGKETAIGETFTSFQGYLKSLKDIGVILNVNSKNQEENAMLGLNHPDGILKPEDFVIIKANWEPKSKNIIDIANELNISTDSLVFVDDNPAEREIVKSQVPGVLVPEISSPENYINILDKSGFFEVINISKEDQNKSKMYKENIKRNEILNSALNYDEYLKSLEMKATVKAFEPLYISRISQLTNKSNQFNLTTKRYSGNEIEELLEDENYITLYGKLSDIFGDNGIVSLIIGKKEENILHIELNLMSCRVLKRDMECAMIDTLVKVSKKSRIKSIRGYYYKTAKNSMVKDFYSQFGFEKISEDENLNSVWNLDIEKYENKNKFIDVEE